MRNFLNPIDWFGVRLQVCFPSGEMYLLIVKHRRLYNVRKTVVARKDRWHMFGSLG